MSSRHILFLVLSCLLGIIHITRQEGCEPGTVIDLTLRGNNTLTWDRSPDEECELAYYLVQVIEADGSIHLSYTTLFPLIHITLLERCKSYIFRVSQVSQDNITGPAFTISAITPPASDANLHLDYLRISQEGVNVRLFWSLEEQYVSCATRYRVVINDRQTSAVRDIYTASTSVLIGNIAPCAPYFFSVRALFTLEEEGPAKVLSHTAAGFVAAAPKFEGVALGSTSVDILWHLGEYLQNRCALSALIVDASPYFQATYPITNQANRDIHLRIGNIAPDTLYYLRVRVNNTAGLSPPSLLAVQTLPSS